MKSELGSGRCSSRKLWKNTNRAISADNKIRVSNPRERGGKREKEELGFWGRRRDDIYKGKKGLWTVECGLWSGFFTHQSREEYWA